MSCKKTVAGKNAMNSIFKSGVIIFVLFSAVHKCLYVNPPKIFDDGDKYDFQSQWLF